MQPGKSFFRKKRVKGLSGRRAEPLKCGFKRSPIHKTIKQDKKSSILTAPSQKTYYHHTSQASSLGLSRIIEKNTKT